MALSRSGPVSPPRPRTTKTPGMSVSICSSGSRFPVSGTPPFFTYFELGEPLVVSSEVYLAQSNNSSPWTNRILPYFRDVNRTASRVVRRLGRGFGATAMTVRIFLAGGNDTDLAALLSDPFLLDIIERPGIIAAQLWRVAQDASAQPGQDRGLRPGNDEISDLTLFIEVTEIMHFESLTSDPAFAAILADTTPSKPPRVAIHQLLNGAKSDEAPSI